ncbi:GntR family transcriptional regulator [Actinocorallia sp. A-T 12471]|uniref:GntR family transcriptional regulator n=1 Tax=Actinocorallia sp. A-T 12471 TaxID=3089813 RepID=UPI0029CF763B|nr:GntR family transcriptional regulator [Actinocorallia sp. A-T 12471]MDX6744315.1 GntR family transcriptional regulator [Actinocorallia sp. A-T 12471]
MSPRVERSRPPYLQIADHYRKAILEGLLVEGQQLPSVARLSEEWTVATATSAKALKQLQSEGLVRATSQGTFVSLATRQTTGPDRLQLLRATGSGYRPGERVEIVGASLTPAPADVAEALGVAEGTSVIRRQRVYRDDDGVVAFSTSWLPGELAAAAPELVSVDPLPKMTFGLIEERTERRAVHRRDVVSIESASTAVAEVLGVEPGTSVLTMTNFYWDQHGDVTEYAKDHLGTGRELSGEYPLG